MGLNTTKRDAAYFESRLKNEHPAIHSDLASGGYSSVRAAAIAAGLITPRGRVAELKNAFKKATAAERREFVDWVRATYNRKAPIGATQPAAPPGHSSAIGSDKLLAPWARKRIEEILLKRGVNAGVVMAEMGSNVRDASLGMALRQNTRLSKIDPLRLDAWIARWSKTLGLP